MRHEIYATKVIIMDTDVLKNRFQTVTRQCKTALYGHPAQTMSEQLQSLADYSSAFESRDVYGDGKLIRDLETRIADILKMDDALYFPSGTMAQPIALKMWSDDKSEKRFAMHETCHIELHEQYGYKTLYGLESVLIGSRDAVPTLSDLEAVQGGLAAVVIELPMREIGGQLPEWQSLVAMSQWARSHNVAFHLDGARVWQCPSYYGRPIEEIAALFDSVYVSLYKDLGGISGAVLLGSTSFIATAKVWLRRAGGNVVTAYPSILSAHKGLEDNLVAMPGAAKAAKWMALWCNAQPRTHTLPVQPQANMFHLFIDLPPDVVLARCIQWMEHNNIALLPMVRPHDRGCKFEINIGRNIQNHAQAWWTTKLSDLWQVLLAP